MEFLIESLRLSYAIQLTMEQDILDLKQGILGFFFLNFKLISYS